MKLLYPVLIGGGYLAYRFFEKKKAVDNLSYQIQGIKFDKSGTDLSHTLMHLTFSVSNPSAESLSFTGFYGTLLYNGNPIAGFITTQPSVTIPPNSVTPVPVDALVNNLSALTLLPALLSGNFAGVLVDGIMSISAIKIPVNFSLNG